MTLALQIQTAPAPPAPPSPIAGETPLPTIIRTVPQDANEVASLRGQRNELSNQLRSVQGRRDDVAEQLQTASAAERPGLEARLRVLDQRILEIEQDIANTGQLMAQAPGRLLATTQAPASQQFSRQIDFTAIGLGVTFFVFAPLAFAIARNLWRRGSRPVAPPAIDRETAERLKRLESGIDAIALEVERISEGQRFVTKLMAEREKQKLTEG